MVGLVMKRTPSSIPLKRTHSYKVSSERCVVKPEKHMMGPIRRLVKKKRKKKGCVVGLIRGEPHSSHIIEALDAYMHGK